MWRRYQHPNVDLLHKRFLAYDKQSPKNIAQKPRKAELNQRK